ncbi:interleukin-7 isoform X1 [Rattus norvegicus]|uniref:interleukin-7 isoform X1 n=1 Tax=Rattus norvegicus TaxID=10116 RepID=UPI0003D09067|nr:interleukin-7 isoform X2 [Rattus norvegicus]|eukprot:XP_006232201.1 PREDICTED: interleukin-7 isoform X1 [Rattus norvegicus]
MFHVSFRYIFGIPPLILVLLPVTSSDCHIKDKDGKAFGSVLMISINQLDKMTGTDSDCPNNEPNFFKKHLCDDTKEAAFLNRAARKLRQFLKMNISEEFNDHLLRVSDGTQTLVNCTSKVFPYSRTKPRPSGSYSSLGCKVTKPIWICFQRLTTQGH